MRILDEANCTALNLNESYGEYTFCGNEPHLFVSKNEVYLWKKINGATNSTLFYKNGIYAPNIGNRTMEKYNDMARFIVNYEKNREMIIEEIERNKLGFAKIDKSLSVEVQLELPEVSNAYQLDIKEENGLNVVHSILEMR